jgi:alpha-L-fucosidase
MTPPDVLWPDLARPMPSWFAAARFGIFIHWGPYSVPAWGEPIGAFGTVPDDQWWAHNPYAEWYWNTIRIDGSPAQQRQSDLYGGAAYDRFLDGWQTTEFDPAAWMQLFADAGAEYVVPTTKHHDGVTLWDAPGTGSRNTVHRGPRRDLVADIGDAARAAGMRFGVYYSGGLDWSVSDFRPIESMADVTGLRPNDAAYATYAYLHVMDLVERYSPDLIFNDIDWPDAGKRLGSYGLHDLFEQYYARVPEGVVNDRWGGTHFDYRTSEYEFSRENESAEVWENNRGLGLSFGYNEAEDESVTMSSDQLIRKLVDVVSRGGRLLLNVGPTASGRIPDIQRRALVGLSQWMRAGGLDVVRGSHYDHNTAITESNDPWVRWLCANGVANAVVGAEGTVRIPVGAARLDAGRAVMLPEGLSVHGRQEGSELVMSLPPSAVPGPSIVSIPFL